jgi:hypothetical protein
MEGAVQEVPGADGKELEDVIVQEEDDECCSVCFSKDCDEDTPIVFCSGCDVAVHQVCVRVCVCVCMPV